MTRSQARQPERRTRGPGCLRQLMLLLVGAALLMLLYAVVLRPMLSRAIADQIAGPARPVPSSSGTASSSGTQPIDQIAAMLPTAVAALPSGEIVISERDANALIAANRAAIAPLERASLRFTGCSAVADIAAYGLTSTASVTLSAEDGLIALKSADIDGPLALMISADTLARSLVDRLNAELAAQGRRVETLQVEEGRMVLVTN